ncbi:putative component of anaerobic dehydrogenase [Desulfosporosinus orientis DSM 765]|uniref:Putative component of anaerobic dehydrogenase n=1 Tax=Desulfosporosinus orientis (strain ATCC 19365 / DSM 765 / NCIMB 8382 / VKM B-1628 / Singapore I) TaxID=768706 RepID=G7W6E7_DESOD|nr:molecular chaperone TorD family protein [Desulfosporosinus orientis]AET68154.1 putative component of anaerobic dehydrogenase [Desulfosporosinus orientis DSM 765]
MTEKNLSWYEYAKAFGFLAGILNNSPHAEMVRQLRDIFSDPGNRFFHGDMHAGNKTMSAYWHQHGEKPLEKIVQELAVDWTHLFRGVNPSYGPPPPYEGVYSEKDRVGINVILDVNQEYLKYGLSIAEDKKDRGDYLGYELDFIRHLAEKAAAAREEGRRDEEEAYKTSICEFLRKHLSWTGGFCSKAADYADTDFYRGFLILLRDTVSEAAAAC